MTPQEIVTLIKKTYHFTDVFQEEDFEMLMDDLKLPLCSSDAGATKGVIIFRDEKFVIKIPFTSITESYGSCSYTDSQGNYQSYNHNEVTNYCRAFQDGIIEYDEDPASNWDYCRLETAIYNAASLEGLENYFAKEELIGYIDNHPIYMQQKCKVFSEMSIEIDYTSKEYKRRKKLSDKYCHKFNLHNFNAYWIADFIEIYGKYEFEKLAAFIKNYNIGDLRDANVGYYDGAPILFDYSGYRD